MEDEVYVTVNGQRLGDILLDECIVGILPEVLNVVQVTGDQVVNADDAVTLFDEQVGEM